MRDSDRGVRREAALALGKIAWTQRLSDYGFLEAMGVLRTIARAAEADRQSSSAGFQQAEALYAEAAAAREAGDDKQAYELYLQAMRLYNEAIELAGTRSGDESGVKTD